MSDITRRSFLGAVAAALPAAATATSHANRAPPSGQFPGPLNPEIFGALGHAVLPSELGTAGIGRVVAHFQQWLREYQPGAELLHGYGTGEIRYTPENPGPRWESQLQTLEAASQRDLGIAFVDLTVERRQDLIRTQIEGDNLERFPSSARARHVAIGLLTYFYATPEATDLCYRAAISPLACRPLSDARTHPASSAPRPQDSREHPEP